MKEKNNLTDRQRNCLNTFRLIAALQVVYGHAIVHMHISVPEIVSKVFGYFQGVPIFFVLSGFLVWDSVGRSKSYPSYLLKRFWRIYPELWIGVFIEAIVLVILYDIGSIKTFVLFIAAQATMLQFWTPSSLRGYGCGTPNGALWTICVMIQFYIVVWFFRKILHGKKVWIWGGAFIISVLLGMVPEIMSGSVPEIVLKLYKQSIFNYFYLFLIGTFLAEHRKKLLPIIKRYWWLLTLVAVVLYVTKIDIPFINYAILKSALGISGIIGFAYVFPNINIKTDISYGIYIYHMTVVNAMITLGFIGKMKYLLISVLISVTVAWISKKTVGEWSARKKSIG